MAVQLAFNEDGSKSMGEGPGIDVESLAKVLDHVGPMFNESFEKAQEAYDNLVDLRSICEAILRDQGT